MCEGTRRHHAGMAQCLMHAGKKRRLTRQALLQRGRLAVVLQAVEGIEVCRLVGCRRREVAASAPRRCRRQKRRVSNDCDVISCKHCILWVTRVLLGVCCVDCGRCRPDHCHNSESISPAPDAASARSVASENSSSRETPSKAGSAADRPRFTHCDLLHR